MWAGISLSTILVKIVFIISPLKIIISYSYYQLLVSKGCQNEKIYVVEGIRDEEILKKLNPNIMTIKTNGFSFDDELINKLIELEKNYQIILILDPDYPGEKIRRELSEKLSNPVNIYIPRDKAISKNNKKLD